jgi:hypothetical protein
MATLRTLRLFQGVSEVGPLPSTDITRLPRYYEPVRHPAWPGLSLAGVRLGGGTAHNWGFPCCVGSPCASMPSPLPRWDRQGLSLVSPRRLRPSPSPCRVGSHIRFFEACSTFTRVTACLLAGPPSGPFHRRLQQLRYLRCCSDCYRLERQLPGRNCTY